MRMSCQALAGMEPEGSCLLTYHLLPKSRFHYRDPAVSRGFTLTLLGLAGVTAVGAAGWWRERKRPR